MSLELPAHPLFDTLRALVKRAGSLLGALGFFLVGGLVVAAAGTFIFSELAGHVMAGGTQAFDEATLRWIERYHSPVLTEAMLEITALGTGVVVITIVCISGLFLTLTRHKYSALLLLVATVGGLLLNNVLKLRFDRPRPNVFTWGTEVATSSFPSGHAMSAAIVYSTVAYLAARLQKRRWARWATMFLAAVIIGLISISRMYLGVHYPSDILAGTIVGLSWAAFCMATLEAIQRFGQRQAPEIKKDEVPAPAPEKG